MSGFPIPVCFSCRLSCRLRVHQLLSIDIGKYSTSQDLLSENEVGVHIFREAEIGVRVTVGVSVFCSGINGSPTTSCCLVYATVTTRNLRRRNTSSEFLGSELEGDN